MCLNPNPAQRPPPYVILHELKFIKIKLFPNVDETKFELYKFPATEDTYINKKNQEYSYYRMQFQPNETDPYKIVMLGLFIQKKFARDNPNEWKIAFDLFKNAADMNSPFGLLNAAICLIDGKGCQKDSQKAFLMLEKAAQMNCEKAICLYGKMIHDGFDTYQANPKKSFQIFEEYSEKNFKMCQYELALMLCYDEKGIPKDVKKGLSLFYRSAQNGYRDGFNEIGLYFYNQAMQGNEEKNTKSNKIP